LRAEIAKREQEFEKLATRQDEERNFGKQLKSVIDPYMPIINAEGGNPAAAVQQLLNTAYILRTASPAEKTKAVLQIAQAYGVDLSQASQPQAYVDPLQERIERLEWEKQQQETAAQQREQAALASEIEAFAKDPSHPHYDAVKPDMAALLAHGRATSLKEAYDMAVYARPDIRSTLLDAQLRAAEEKRVAEAKAKADQARRAGGSVNGSPGLAVPNTGAPDRSLREELQANFRQYVN
jgi:hypothetical protein